MPSLPETAPRPRAARLLPVVAVMLAAGFALGGCAPAIIAVGAATYGAAVVHDRRSPQTVLDDEAIEIRAKALYVQDKTMTGRSRVRVVSYNHAVLLAGQVEYADLALGLAEQVAALPKVTRVHNEIEVGPNISLTQQGKDGMIAARGDLALADVPIPGFDPTRVKVIVENGAVFLMGLVTPEEGDAAAEKLSRLPGVTRVVKLFDYVEAGS